MLGRSMGHIEALWLHVLDPAIRQINDDPIGVGVTVEYTPIRSGPFHHELGVQLAIIAKRTQTGRLCQESTGRPEFRTGVAEDFQA